MPSKLKSGGVFPYMLKDDRDDQAAPVFQLRVLSCMEEQELRDARDRYFERGKDDASEAVMLEEMVAVAVVAHNMKGVSSLIRELTSAECFELVAGAIGGCVMTAEERKKFVWQPTLESGCSVDAEQPASMA
jgi:hypothetical protein